MQALILVCQLREVRVADWSLLRCSGGQKRTECCGASDRRRSKDEGTTIRCDQDFSPSVLGTSPAPIAFRRGRCDRNLVDDAVDTASVWWILVTVLLIGLFVALAIGKADKRWVTITILFMIVPLAAVWHSTNQQRYDAESIRQFVSEDARPSIVEGVVDRPAVLKRHPLADRSWRRDQSPWQTQLEVRLEQMQTGLDWISVDGRVLVSVDGRYDELQPGDSIRIYGSIEGFSAPGNPGEQDFRQIYRQRNLHARIHVDSIGQIERLRSAAWRPGRWIATIARSGRERLMQSTGAQTGPLAVALVIGQREFVSPDLRDQLLVTGTVHLLSVSGLHLAIIVVLAHWIATLFRFPPTAKFIWILGVCLLYTAVTGARPPVVRAAVLVTTFMVAFWVKRPSQPINTLSLAALIILAWNPTLVFGIGVQLSFLAVATLLLCQRGPVDESAAVKMAVEHEDRLPALAEKSRSRPVFYARYQSRELDGDVVQRLRDGDQHAPGVVRVSRRLADQCRDERGVESNLVCCIGLGGCDGRFGSVRPLGWLFGTICDWSISVMAWIIDRAASIPLGHLWLPSPPTRWVVTFYLVLASLYFDSGRGLRTSDTAGWSWMAIAWVGDHHRFLDDGSIEATFVDVGHGTSVVLRFC